MREILIVDDDAGARAAMGQLLRGAGYPVAEADDGRAALQYLEGRTPSAIILDVIMPGFSGYDTLRALRERHQHPPPVVIVTGPGAFGGSRHALDGGAAAYLRKRDLYDPDSGLCATVRALLA